MKTFPKVGAIGASLALAAASFGLAAGSAGAAEPFSSELTGTFTLQTDNPIPVPVTGSVIGERDGDTFTGNVSIDEAHPTTSINAPVIGPTQATLTLRFIEGDDGITNGLIDGSDISFDNTQTVQIVQAVASGITIPFASGCKVGPIDLHYTGTYDEVTGDVDVTAEVEDLQLAGSCGEFAGQNLTGLVGDLLNGSSASVEAHANLLANDDITPPDDSIPDDGGPTTSTPGDDGPTTTTPADGVIYGPGGTIPAGGPGLNGNTAPAATTPAPAAAPVSATPSYTG